MRDLDYVDAGDNCTLFFGNLDEHIGHGVVTTFTEVEFDIGLGNVFFVDSSSPIHD